jgi:hypothetical protein
MASEIDIVNGALHRIGANTIASLTEGTKNANVAVDVYAETRDQLLRGYQWGFATKRVQLAQLSTAPTFEYNNAYQLPSDHIRIISVHDNDAGYGTVEYKVRGSTLESDAEEIYLRYVSRETDPNLMPPDFRDALSYRLAMIFALAIADSNTMFGLMREEFEKTVLAAASVDAIEDYPEWMPDGSWVSERGR